MIVTTDDENYKRIAEAIRINGYTSDTLKPSEMANGVGNVARCQYEDGYYFGYQEGEEDGWTDGYNEGYDGGYEQGVKDSELPDADLMSFPLPTEETVSEVSEE